MFRYRTDSCLILSIGKLLIRGCKIREMTITGGPFFSLFLLPVLGLEDHIFPFDLLCFITFKVVFFMQAAFHVLFSPTELYLLPPGCALCDVLSSPYLQLGSDLTSFCLTIQ